MRSEACRAKRVTRAVATAVLAVAALGGCGDDDFGDSDEPPAFDVVADLEPLRAGGEPGRLEVSKRENETVQLVIAYPSAMKGGPYTTHLHHGTCESRRAVVRELEPLVAGRSETHVPIGFDDLFTEQYTVDVHSSPEADEPLTCTEIVDNDVG